MEQLIYQILDITFIIFHTLLILFNVFGWLWEKTRFINFITLNLTAFSWFILGIWFGWGYCFCTDWHWEVRNHLNKPVPFNSYISFLIYEISGLRFPQKLVDIITLIVFLFSYIMSLYFQLKKIIKIKKFST